MVNRGKSRVRKRRVFYIPGFDPYPPRRYRELYRTESRKQAAISGYRIDQKSDASDTGWRVRADIEGAQVMSKVDVLVWHDLVQKSMSGTIASTYLALVKTVWIYLSTGAFRRLTWLAKGPIIAALYPIGMLIAQLLISLIAAWWIGSLISGAAVLGADALLALLGRVADVNSWAWRATESAIHLGVFFPATLLFLRWFKAMDGRTFAYYLMQDYAFTASAQGAYPKEIEARLHVFRHKVEKALEEDIDEVLIVGHSSGAQMAVSIVADLVRLKRVQDGGPVLSLLTLGQVIPMLSFLPEAHRLRRDLRLLSTCEEITWIDVSAPGDGCSFALCDPVSVSGVAPARGQQWPIVISAAFTKTLSDKMQRSLRHRYFRLHFQYLCAFDRPGDYDYFRITAGPLTLGARFRGRRPSASRIDVVASRFTSTAA